MILLRTHNSFPNISSHRPPPQIILSEISRLILLPAQNWQNWFSNIPLYRPPPQIIFSEISHMILPAQNAFSVYTQRQTEARFESQIMLTGDDSPPAAMAVNCGVTRDCRYSTCHGGIYFVQGLGMGKSTRNTVFESYIFYLR